MRVRVAARWAAVAFAAAMAAGCGGRAKTAPKVDDGAPYRIGREDVLDISVWRDPEMSRVVPVRPDGSISLPMVGDVTAAGKTPAELGVELRSKLAPFIQEPKVAVIVREVNSSRVFVTGEVARPGAYPLRGRVSILQAIALAGGFTAFADQDGIVVIRRGDRGGRFAVRYSDLVSDSDADVDADVVLIPGDTVVVP